MTDIRGQAAGRDGASVLATADCDWLTCAPGTGPRYRAGRIFRSSRRCSGDSPGSDEWAGNAIWFQCAAIAAVTTGRIDGKRAVADAVRAARPDVRNVAVDIGSIR